MDDPLATLHAVCITLSARDSAAFVEALRDPPLPNAALQEAAARYRAVIQDQDLIQDHDPRNTREYP